LVHPSATPIERSPYWTAVTRNSLRMPLVWSPSKPRG